MKHRIALLLLALTSLVVACRFATGNPEAPKLGSVVNVVWAGDLDGSTMISQKVTGIEGHGIAPPPAGEGGLAIEWDGSALYWGTAGGAVAPGDAGQFLVTNDAGTATAWVTPHGDVDASATDPGALTVTGLQNNPITSGTPTTGNQLRWSGSAWGGAALNLAGGSGYVSGLLPVANEAPGTAGQIKVSNATPAAAWTSLISYETTHGRFSSGGGGSDYVATMGPMVGLETTYAAVYLLPSGTSLTSANVTLYSDGSSGFINAQSGIGTVGFTAAGSYIGAFNANASRFYAGGATGAAPFIVDWATSAQTQFLTGSGQSSLLFGTTKSGASMTLISDVAVTNQTLTATNDAFGGSGSTAPLAIDWTTSTLPAIAAGSNATQLTIGTTKSGAALVLKGDNATSIASLTTRMSLLTDFDMSPEGAPGSPSATKVRVYVDSADNKLKAINSSGDITVIAP